MEQPELFPLVKDKRNIQRKTKKSKPKIVDPGALWVEQKEPFDRQGRIASSRGDRHGREDIGIEGWERMVADLKEAPPHTRRVLNGWISTTGIDFAIYGRESAHVRLVTHWDRIDDDECIALIHGYTRMADLASAMFAATGKDPR